jgi:hypothetical protein
MNEEQIRDEARKAANRSQFMSNHIYDHKSYEDGFYEGMNQALRQYGVMQRSEQLVAFVEWLEANSDNSIDKDWIHEYIKATNCA